MSSSIEQKKKPFTLENILHVLEDPNYPSVGPHLRLLEFTGLWHPNLNSTLSRFKMVLFYVTVSFFFTQYLKCLINFNAVSLKLILQYAPFHMGIVKSCFFQKNYKTWEHLIEFVSSVERNQIFKKDDEHDKIMKDYIKRSRKVTYFFWALAFFSNFSIFTEPYQKNQFNEKGTSVYLCIFDGYTPFSKEPPGYYASMFIQTVLGHIVSAYVIGWDMLVVTIMIFFAGQLRMSRLYCSRVINLQNPRLIQKNIAECHHFYTTLVKYQKTFNTLISPVMFVYLIVISVNLGVCIIEIAKIENDLRTFVSSCVFMMACLIQLLLFYWYSNEVTVESNLVSYSSFESNWVEVNKQMQKEIALLGITTKKTLVFKAGPYHEMSLSTFIAILRASYSFYTLVIETN